MFDFSFLRRAGARFLGAAAVATAAIAGIENKAVAQVNIITPDTTLCGNSVTPVTLNATIGNGAGNFVSFSDDIYSPLVNIGFPFTFYGTTYTQCVLSSNGLISFNLSNAGQYSGYQITGPGGVPGNTNALNSVMGAFSDINPFVGGTIDYSTQGTAPNRKFVVTFCNTALFSCTNLAATFQMVLFETTNNIEIHIANKPVCLGWNSGGTIEGVQNAAGTAAVTVPGRNFPGTWTATNSAHRFTPTAAGSYQVDSIGFGFLANGVTSIVWTVNGITTPAGTGPTITVTPTAPSTFYVATANGCLGSTSRDTVTVTIGPLLPVPGVVTPQTYCQGATPAPLTATVVPGATAIWYDVPTGGVGSTTPPVFTTTNTFRDTFYVQQVSGGCSSLRAPLVVEVLPQPVASLAPDRDSMCLEDTAIITFTGNAPTGSQLIWDFGDGTLVNGPATGMGPYAVYYPTPGVRNIGIVVIAPGGSCIDAATTQVYVKEKPIASLDIVLPDACAGDVRVVRNTSPDVSGSVQYLWDFDGGDIVSGSDGGPYSIRWNDPGMKRVRLTIVKDGCYSEPAYDSIPVYPQPTARILHVVDRSVCIGDTIRLEAEQSGNVGDVYRWYPASWFIPENYINNTNQAAVKIPTSGYATLQVLTRYGCEDRDSVYFDAGSCCQISIPSAFSPNGDGKNDYFRLLGTERTRRIVDVQVINRYGQEVWRARDGRSSWDGTRAGAPQEPGVYFYRVQYECPDGKVIHTSGDVTLIR